MRFGRSVVIGRRAQLLLHRRPASVSHLVTIHHQKSSMICTQQKLEELISYRPWWETRAAGIVTGGNQQGRNGWIQPSRSGRQGLFLQRDEK